MLPIDSLDPVNAHPGTPWLAGLGEKEVKDVPGRIRMAPIEKKERN